MRTTFKDKTVLITGGTGSFGANFSKALLKNTKLKKLIIFSRDEFKQHHLEKELDDNRVRFFIGDVRDLSRLRRAFHDVDMIVHAAALKQVPALEYNPFEAIQTNVIGAQNVIDAAIDQNVPKVLFISTDKAVHPINLYGATKLCAEKLFVSANAYSPQKTQFSIVRYGNVIGSRGSVIEMLLKNKGAKTVHVTNLEMTRFWITLTQSFQLVTDAFKQMRGGEIFVPKIPSMKIVDLFNVIVPNAKKKIIGIRPGEKLHEILLTSDEARNALELKSYFIILPKAYWTDQDLYQRHLDKGARLPPDFTYGSNTNDVWLTPKDLKKIIAEVEI